MKKFLLLITVIFVVITVTTCAEKKDDTVTLLTHVLSGSLKAYLKNLLSKPG